MGYGSELVSGDNIGDNTLISPPVLTRVRTLINADGTEASFELTRESAITFATAAAKAFGVGPDQMDVKFDAKMAREALKPKEAKPKKGAKADAKAGASE